MVVPPMKLVCAPTPGAPTLMEDVGCPLKYTPILVVSAVKPVSVEVGELPVPSNVNMREYEPATPVGVM